MNSWDLSVLPKVHPTVVHMLADAAVLNYVPLCALKGHALDLN